MSAKIKVALCDHTPTILRALERLLRTLDEVEVVGIANGVDEVLMMEAVAQVDVIVYGFSVLVPRSLSGFARLRRKLPHAHIIATSFDPDNEGRDAILEAGANDYVSGFELDTHLVPAILRTLDRTG